MKILRIAIHITNLSENQMSCCESVSVGKFCADCGKKKNATQSGQQQLDRLLANSIDLGNCDLVMSFIDRSVVDDSIENKTFQSDDNIHEINVPRHTYEEYSGCSRQHIFVSPLSHDKLEYDMKRISGSELNRGSDVDRKKNSAGNRNRGKGHGEYENKMFDETVGLNGTLLIRNKFLDDIHIDHFCVMSLTTVGNMLINAIKNKIRTPTFVTRLTSKGFDYDLYKETADHCGKSRKNAVREKQQRFEQLIKSLGCFGTIYLMDGHFYCLETLESETKGNGFVFDWSKTGNMFKIFDLNIIVMDDDCATVVRTIISFGRCGKNGAIRWSGGSEELMLMLKHMVDS
jgi:hypothetical protein